MGAADLVLYNDIINNRLVTSLSDARQFQLPTLFQGSTLAIKYYAVVPTNSVMAPFFTKVAVDALTLEIGVGVAAGSEALKAYQGTWTPDTDNDYLAASLNLNTSEMNAAIGTSGAYRTAMEIILGESGVKRTTWQGEVVIAATVIGPTGAVSLPAAATEYYTKSELDALFVKWTNDAVASRGKTVTLVSASGTAQRSLGIADDGTATDDIVI